MAESACPPWCRSPHEHGVIAHVGPVHGGTVWARAVLNPEWPALQIVIDAAEADALFLTPADATRLAVLLSQAGVGGLAVAIRLAVDDTGHGLSQQ